MDYIDKNIKKALKTIIEFIQNGNSSNSQENKESYNFLRELDHCFFPDQMEERYFRIIKEYTYEEISSFLNQRIIVSFTSYPKRIKFIPEMLPTLLNQSKKADSIVLWLAEEEFPGRKIPEELSPFISDKQLTVEWCTNIKPHKKYYYAMKEYYENIIITVDDDLYYEKKMIEDLFLSYLEYPDAISAKRTHIIGIDSKNCFLPYERWIKENNYLIGIPSMELFATNGAGTLFPPHIISVDLFDIDTIKTLCPLADDILLKSIEIILNVPVVQSSVFSELNYIDFSQEDSLMVTNVDNRFNDTQLQNIKGWVDKKYNENNYLEKRILSYGIESSLYNMYSRSGFISDNELIRQNTVLSNKVDILQKQIDEISGSETYKIGKQITSLYRFIKDKVLRF